MEKSAKIYVAGHQGLVGGTIYRHLQRQGFGNLVYRSLKELDLRDQPAVAEFFQQERPEYVFLAAARVGGILANNTYPADFIYRNQVRKLMFLGSSCIYPKLCPQPMQEEYLLAGKLEPTNEPYAVAKIAGIRMCQSYNRQYHTCFISVMPTNLYGPGDNFDLLDSHVIPGLIHKFHRAKLDRASEVSLWGTGAPRREFLYVADLADACLFLMEQYNSGEIINIGLGEDLTIRELAHQIAEVVGFSGRLVFDPAYPDGAPRKLLDVSRITRLGWRARTPLTEGLVQTYEWFRQSRWGQEAAPAGVEASGT
jgi:GDP-L-fucose synthase